MKDEDSRSYFPPDSEETMLFERLYLYGFDIEEFKNKWNDFVAKDFRTFDNASIRKSIRDVMSFTNPITKQTYYNIPTWTFVFNKGQKFYRVRRIGNNEITVPTKELSQWSDIWNPPEQCVNDYGRLNYPAESFLYTSADYPMLAVNELKLSQSEPFVLITYEAKEDIFVTIIGYHKKREYLLEVENEKLNYLTSFFEDIFTKDVSDQTRYFYKVSSNLIKECYTLNDDTQDGWVYPSIANKKGFNVCFKPASALKKLKITGIELCKVERSHGFLINYVVDDINENSRFSYHLVGSEVQRQKYPHISMKTEM